MISNPKKRRKVEISLKIGHEILAEKDHLTYLGVIFNNKMSFKQHFNKGPSINDFASIFAFFDPPPSPCCLS